MRVDVRARTALLADAGDRARRGLRRGGRSRAALAEYYRPLQVRWALRHVPPALLENRTRPYDRRIRSIVRDGAKLIWGSDGRHELYDLREDPLETRNVLGAPDDSGLRDTLWREPPTTVERHADSAAALDSEERPTLDEETREALRSPGHLE